MPVPTTNEDWETLISDIKASLLATLEQQYPAPQDPASIAATIDHTLLSLSATTEQVDALCTEARTHSFATVCVRVNHVQRAVKNLSGTAVGVACVVGFHEGTQKTAEKVAEALEAVQQGASELDMVMNYPLLKERNIVGVAEDIRAVRDAAKGGVRLKVIIETSQLNRDEIIAASAVTCLTGADFVKTSTGFNGPGASVENVSLMRAVAEKIGRGTKVKASGGVRTADDCKKMIQAGADRIGASAGVKIVQGMASGEPNQAKDNTDAGTY